MASPTLSFPATLGQQKGEYQMRKFGLVAAGVSLAMVVSGSAYAQSSKFTAAYETDDVLLAWAYADDAANDPDFDIGFERTVASIKAPQGKELLIGVSGVVGLVTFTEAKGTNKAGKSTSEALAGVGLAVRYKPQDEPGGVCAHGTTAAPGIIPLSVRYQRLSVEVDLDVVDAGTCTAIDGDGNLEEGECLAELLDIEGDVTVSLGLATAAAHHSNFIAGDLPRSTTYDVAACIVGVAAANIVEGEGTAYSAAAIGKRIITVQEVRAVKDTEFDVTQ